MEMDDDRAIDMLDQFGADQHFEIAKSSAIVCIDNIIHTIYQYGTVVEEKNTEKGLIFWNKVKLRLWEMRITEYAEIKNINY